MAKSVLMSFDKAEKRTCLPSLVQPAGLSCSVVCVNCTSPVPFDETTNKSLSPPRLETNAICDPLGETIGKPPLITGLATGLGEAIGLISCALATSVDLRLTSPQMIS